MRNSRGTAGLQQPSQSGRAPAARSLAAVAGPGDDAVALWRDLLLRGAVIVLASLWIYSPTYHGDWLWDDDSLLTANPVVQSGTLAGLWKLWFNPDGADYFPLSYSALWAQWPFFGTNPTGYHAVTIVLHAIGALLLWRMLVVMRIPGAWLAGILFAVHPVCVETVGWVSEIKNTVSLPPFLLSAICFAKHDEAAQGSGRDTARRSTTYHALALGWFLVAMFAKTSMVMFPVVLLLHAWWRRGRITVRDLLAAAPFFLVSLILGLVTIHYQHGRAIGEEKMPVADLFTIAGFLSRTAVAGMAILFYLWKSIWPFQLLPIYPRWEVDPPQPWQLLPWPIMGAAAWWLWKRRGTAEAPTWERHTLFTLGFFLLMLLPILGFITISYMRITWVADHFLYLPLIGPIALLSAFAATWFATLQPRLKLPVIAATVTALVLLAGSSFRYAHVFAGEDPLWIHTLASNPDAWQAHNRLGARKFARGDVDGGLYHFENSTRLRPDLGETHNNLGTALMSKGRVDEALVQFRTAAELIPYMPQMQLNLSNALLQSGRLDESEKTLRKTVEQFPALPQGWNNLGFVQLKRGDFATAITSLRRACELQPEWPDVKANLQAALRAEAERLAREKKFAPAEAMYRELLKALPDDTQLLTNHGVTLYELGRKEEAIAAFRRVLAINPEAIEAKQSLAIATGTPIPPAAPLPDEQAPLPSTLAPPAGLR